MKPFGSITNRTFWNDWFGKIKNIPSSKLRNDISKKRKSKSKNGGSTSNNQITNSIEESMEERDRIKMLKKDDKVILENRGTKEFGTILRKWRRKDVMYCNVMTERGIKLEGLTSDPSFPCYINEELSIKYNIKKDDKD